MGCHRKINCELIFGTKNAFFNIVSIFLVHPVVNKALRFIVSGSPCTYTHRTKRIWYWAVNILNIYLLNILLNIPFLKIERGNSSQGLSQFFKYSLLTCYLSPTMHYAKKLEHWKKSHFSLFNKYLSSSVILFC